jgi:hypothetical protein
MLAEFIIWVMVWIGIAFWYCTDELQRIEGKK